MPTIPTVMTDGNTQANSTVENGQNINLFDLIQNSPQSAFSSVLFCPEESIILEKLLHYPKQWTRSVQDN